jgi:hypothetical protein
VKLRASVDGRDVDVEVGRSGAGIHVTLAGALVPVDVRELQPGVYSLLVGDRSFEVRVLEEDGTDPGTTRMRVCLYDDEYVVDLLDPRRTAGSRPGGGSRGAERLVAPMHGKVVRVLAREGDVVARGQGVVIMEAMKMQNELRAARGGVVTEMRAVEGQSVHQGALLGVIAAPSEDPG